MEKIIKVDNLIIGAGISGLSFSSFLDSNNYLILEKENKPGGLCKSFYIDEFIWDYSGHFFHFKTDYWKSFFINAVGLENIVSVEKNTKIFLKNRLVDYPFQSNINQLDNSDFKKCLEDLKKANNQSGSSFLEMIYNRFGEGICNLFLKSYNEKLYSCDLNVLDKNAMGRFFPQIDKNIIINSLQKKQIKTYNDSFLYPKNGCQAIISCFEPNKKNIRYNSCIRKIDVKNHIIETENEIYSYKNLISSAPLSDVFELLNFKDKEKIDFSYNKVKVFNIGFSKGLSKCSIFYGVHWLYFPEKEFCFYRVGFYNHIANQDKLSLYVEIGYSKDEVEDVNIKEVLNDLLKAGIIDGSFKMSAFNELTMTPAYVHIESKTEEKIKKMFVNLAEQNIYFLGRYGRWTYCSIEDCLIGAKELADKLKYE